MLLADLACEDENFESALPDYERAMDLLTAPKEVLTRLRGHRNAVKDALAMNCLLTGY